MPQASKTFRIFVSSTFSDLKEERNALQKYVFPRLRELCMQHGCRFQAIDLRWGVSEEASRDQQTMKICLEEIKRCQRVTPRPNFIVLLGDRYGWRPLPEEIPEDEFHQIFGRATKEERAQLLWKKQQPLDSKGWYRKDRNAKPPVYCLQPRGAEYADRGRWDEVEKCLRSILERGIEGVAFSDEEAQAKYIASATEQEIIRGLKTPAAAEHVYCFFRHITTEAGPPVVEDLPQDTAIRDFVDVDEDSGERPVLDRDRNHQLGSLKQRLRDLLPNNVHDYDSIWKGEEAGPDHIGPSPDHIGSLPESLEECVKLIDEPPALSTLCIDVWRRLARVILDQINQFEAVTTQEKEERDHEDFGKDRAKHFTGRASYLEVISNYLKADDAHPLAIWGESGSGKSALMARAVAQAREAYPSARIVERFIGATPGSSDGRALLESLCKEITEHYGEDEQSVPAEYQKLVKDFQKRLELATQDKPLIIFLDALDQLSDNEHARNLAWLPDKLPPQVHVIVSTLPGECLSHLEQMLPADNLLKLDQMTSSEGDELLDLWLADAKRRLGPAQREVVLKEFRVNGLPLYLKLVLEEARRWKSYSLAQRFPADIPGMIRAMLRRLMAEHGLMLIERALGYIAAARHGLSEDELLDVLSMDEKVFDDFLQRARHKPAEQRLPVVVWSRLYFDLEPYLTERSADGASLLGFYHRQLGEVVTEEFLAADAKRERHIALGKFFAGQDYFLETLEAQRERARRLPLTTRPANLRKASELAWQLLRAEQWEKLEGLLTDLFFLEAKAEAGMVFDLASDFSAAAKAIPGERPQRRILLLLEEAVHRDIHFIARHPTRLFQCLWNSCWWYDCPEAARHYKESEGPWSRPGPKLHKLLEAWRAAREENYFGSYWVRSLRPPATHLGTAQRV